MSESFDIAACRNWIGREQRTSDCVTPGLVQRFNATFDGPADAPEHGALAPLGIHWCLAPLAAPTAALGSDGHPARGGFLPPIPLPRRMWAGSQLTFGAPIRVGDVVERASRIEAVTHKQGRTGPLGFVTIQQTLTVAGVPVVEERQDLVFRGLESITEAAEREAASPPARQPALAQSSKTVAVSEALLFRYSALTFNGHRIHYDRRYCTDVEHYPGLVVHGPLQATFLLHFAALLRGGQPPVHFAFRSTAPLFDGTPFNMATAETPDGLRLWTANAAGQAAMTAAATW